jgi:S-adenosylmethionine-diacylgycerolhomoserine-N-methlytransferase
MSATAAQAIERYYRLHARIYDASRWSFLFGRHALVGRIAILARPQRILEIGCGTGTNLRALARRFPQAHLTGVDLSADMLAVARRKLAPLGGRVTLREQAYTTPLREESPFDLVVFSYALSMFNPGWEAALAAARADLHETGLIAVVDFDDSGAGWFRRWMGMNHVRMDGHLLPALDAHFTPLWREVSLAYGGLWRYLTFVGRKRPADRSLRDLQAFTRLQ